MSIVAGSPSGAIAAACWKLKAQMMGCKGLLVLLQLFVATVKLGHAFWCLPILCAAEIVVAVAGPVLTVLS